MLSDEALLEILALYDMGWGGKEIDGMLGLARGTAQEVIDADAEAYPDEPLRSDLVLH